MHDARVSGRTGVKVKVLVVDHKPPVLEALVRMLKVTDGVEVLGAATNPKEAVHDVYALHPDVIIYGFDAHASHRFDDLRELRPRLPNTFIIASSFAMGDNGGDEALAAGADTYINGFSLDTDLIPLILAHERKQTR